MGFCFSISNELVFLHTWKDFHIYSNFHILFLSFASLGLRAVHTDRHPGDAAGGLRDGTRVHVCDAEAAADDHVGGGQGSHPDVPELAGPAEWGGHGRPADERDGLRGDGAELQHRRRGLQSKAIGVRPSRARSLGASTGGGRRSLWPGPKPDAADVRWRRRRWPVVTVVAPAAVRDPRALASFAHTAPACDAHDPCSAVISRGRDRDDDNNRNQLKDALMFLFLFRKKVSRGCSGELYFIIIIVRMMVSNFSNVVCVGDRRKLELMGHC